MSAPQQGPEYIYTPRRQRAMAVLSVVIWALVFRSRVQIGGEHVRATGVGQRARSIGGGGGVVGRGATLLTRSSTKEGREAVACAVSFVGRQRSGGRTTMGQWWRGGIEEGRGPGCTRGRLSCCSIACVNHALYDDERTGWLEVARKLGL